MLLRSELQQTNRLLIRAATDIVLAVDKHKWHMIRLKSHDYDRNIIVYLWNVLMKAEITVRHNYYILLWCIIRKLLNWKVVDNFVSLLFSTNNKYGENSITSNLKDYI